MLGSISANTLHKKGENTRSFIVYSVWDNRTDEVVIIDGEARECAEAMGMTLASFYSAITRAKSGAIKRWTIKPRYLDGGKRRTKFVKVESDQK